MAITKLDYFADDQQERYLQQIIRAFSGYQYMTGRRGDKEPELKMVPCRHAIADTVMANIMRNQSESVLNVCPMITVYQTDLVFDQSKMLNPAHVETIHGTERQLDDTGENYLEGAGRSFSVTRKMPLPFIMTVKVDLWTSNINQRNQLVEQICSRIYPDFQIQSSENPLDWSALSLCTPDPNMTLSSMQIPVGAGEEIAITSFTINLVIHINPPALIRQQSLIEKVVTNLSDRGPVLGLTNTEDMGYVVVTSGNHSIHIDGSEIRLLGPNNTINDPQGNPYSWPDLLDKHGKLYPAYSQIQLLTDINDESGISGTIDYTNDPSILHWNIDPMTLPTNTLESIDGIVNPLETFPNQKLPPEVAGQRYVFLNDIGGPTQAWGDLVAKENDIVQYDGTRWNVVFSAAYEQDTHYVLNMASSKQLKWNGSEWLMAIDGVYPNALWRLML